MVHKGWNQQTEVVARVEIQVGAGQLPQAVHHVWQHSRWFQLAAGSRRILAGVNTGLLPFTMGRGGSR